MQHTEKITGIKPGKRAGENIEHQAGDSPFDPSQTSIVKLSSLGPSSRMSCCFISSLLIYTRCSRSKNQPRTLSRFATEKSTGGRRELFPSRVLKILVGIFVSLCREEYIKLRPIQHFFPSRREKISSTPDKILSDPKWETRRGPRFGVVGSTQQTTKQPSLMPCRVITDICCFPSCSNHRQHDGFGERGVYRPSSTRSSWVQVVRKQGRSRFHYLVSAISRRRQPRGQLKCGIFFRQLSSSWLLLSPKQRVSISENKGLCVIKMRALDFFRFFQEMVSPYPEEI